MWSSAESDGAMYQLFEGAQSVVFLFDSVAETYCRLFAGALDARKIHIIPNGYDGDAFGIRV